MTRKTYRGRQYNGHSITYNWRQDWVVTVDDEYRALTHWAEDEPPILIGASITCHVRDHELSFVEGVGKGKFLVVDQLRDAQGGAGRIIGMHWARRTGIVNPRTPRVGYDVTLQVLSRATNLEAAA